MRVTCGPSAAHFAAVAVSRRTLCTVRECPLWGAVLAVSSGSVLRSGKRTCSGMRSTPGRRCCGSSTGSSSMAGRARILVRWAVWPALRVPAGLRPERRGPRRRRAAAGHRLGAAPGPHAAPMFRTWCMSPSRIGSDRVRAIGALHTAALCFTGESRRAVRRHFRLSGGRRRGR